MSNLNPESKRLLALAREARTPSIDDRARVARRLALAVGVSAGAATTVTTAAAVQAAAGSSAAGAHLGAEATAGHAAAGTAKAAAAWGAGKLSIAGVVLLTAAGAYLTFSRAPASPSAQHAKPSAKLAEPSSKLAEPSALILQRVAASEARVEERAQPNATVVETPSPKAPATAESRVRARRSGSETLPHELELLHRAQVAWRDHAAARALELVEQHRRAYPKSALRTEREALEVLALCEVGKSRQAARLARSLLKRAPDSPSRAAIEESCALE
jgi:hypothetical protein